MRLLVFVVVLGCRSTARPVPAVHNTARSPATVSPAPAADGRLLVTADCSGAPRQPEIIRDGALTEHRLEPDATFRFAMRGSELFLEVTGESPMPLGTGAMDDLEFPADVDAEVIDGIINTARLPQGGPANEHYRLRLNGCAVELLHSSGDDLGDQSEESVRARYVIAPRTRVWAR